MLESQKGTIGFNRLISDTKVAKVSVVGVGMKSHAGAPINTPVSRPATMAGNHRSRKAWSSRP